MSQDNYRGVKGMHLFVITIWQLSNVRIQRTEGEEGGRGTLLEGASNNFMVDLFAHLLSVA